MVVRFPQRGEGGYPVPSRELWGFRRHKKTQERVSPDARCSERSGPITTTWRKVSHTAAIQIYKRPLKPTPVAEIRDTMM